MRQGNPDSSDAALPVAASTDPVRLAWAGLISLAAAMGVGRFVYTPILPPMAEALHLSQAQAGWIASANFAGYLAGAMLAAGALPGSARAWLMAGLVASAVSTAVMGLTTALTMFALIRFVGGVASALVLVCGSTVVLEQLGAAGRSDLIGRHFAGVGVGIAASAILVSTLEAAGAGWHDLWLASGAVSLLAILAVAMLLPAAPPQTASAPAAVGPATLRARRRLSLLFWAYGLVGFGYVITATFLVAIVRGSAAARTVEPVVWVVVGLAAVPSVAAWMRIGRKIGLAEAFALGSVIEALGVVDSVFFPTIEGALVAAALLGVTFIGLTALGLTAVREGSTDPRRALGWMTAAFGIGQIIGPAFAGYVSHLTGDFVAASLCAAVALLIAALLAAASRRAHASSAIDD
jgi:predicted MFS family arabinose efflux permease